MGKIINTVKSIGGKMVETFRPKNGLATMDIFKANERIVELEKQLESKPISNSLTHQVIDIEAMKVELEAKHSLQLETLKNEYEAKLVEAMKQVEVAKQSANREAARIMASLGVEQSELPKMTPEDFNGNKNNGVTVVNLLNRK